MRPSRMMGVEEVDPNVFFDGADDIGAPGYYGDGIGSPGYMSDGAAGIEPVMTLSSHETPGRTARRRSMAGQLRREAQAFGRRDARQQLAGLGGPWYPDGCDPKTSTSWNSLRDPSGQPLARNQRYRFDDDKEECKRVGGCYLNAGGIQACFFRDQGDRHFPSAIDPVFNYSVNIANKAIESKTGVPNAIPKAPVGPNPLDTQTGGSMDVKSIINARLAQGKTAAKKSKLVPIVAGVAAVGLIAWLL